MSEFSRALQFRCQWNGSLHPLILELDESSFSGLDPQSHKEHYGDMENYLPGGETKIQKYIPWISRPKLFIVGQRISLESN